MVDHCSGVLASEEIVETRGLKGDFQSTRKLNPEIVCEQMTIDVDGNRLAVKSDDWSGGAYEATIVMSDELPGSGRRHYRHRHEVDGTPEWLWGFVELQVMTDDTLLIHHTYAHYKEFRAVVSGFMWERLRHQT